jgi:hypothetical protein
MLSNFPQPQKCLLHSILNYDTLLFNVKSKRKMMKTELSTFVNDIEELINRQCMYMNRIGKSI